MKSSELFRILKKDGWYIYREAKGSHRVLRHESKSGEVHISSHGSHEVPTGTLNKILKDAGLK